MQVKHVLVLVVVAVAAVAGYLFKQDYDYRQLHGRVTEVGYLNWEQEVLKSDTPVLIYFYRDDRGRNPQVSAQAAEAQKREVSDFAWSNAGKVKVVACDAGKPENLVLAIAHGAFRFPAYIVVVGENVVEGNAGSALSSEDLERMLARVKQP
ncbi:MAG: hypothetical protein AB7W16_00425 [Candidatus Obscuribacterales bacterium]